MKQAAFILLALMITAQSVRADGFALGLASDYHAVRSTSSALTGLFVLGSGDLIQAYFLMENQDVNNTGTVLGIAGHYKHVIAGSSDNGFHVGAGIGMGSFPKDRSWFHVNGIAGFRFSPAQNVFIHADGGISLGTADSKTEFLIGGNSFLLGLTLAYLL